MPTQLEVFAGSGKAYWPSRRPEFPCWYCNLPCWHKTMLAAAVAKLRSVAPYLIMALVVPGGLLDGTATVALSSAETDKDRSCVIRRALCPSRWHYDPGDEDERGKRDVGDGNTHGGAS